MNKIKIITEQINHKLEIFDIWEEEHRSEFPNQAVDTTILIDEE